jgi:hypothetical protein
LLGLADLLCYFLYLDPTHKSIGVVLKKVACMQQDEATHDDDLDDLEDLTDTLTRLLKSIYDYSETNYLEFFSAIKVRSTASLLVA